MTSEEHHDGGHGQHGGGHEHAFDVESFRNDDLLYAGVYGQVVDWLAIPDGASVLEAGCGAGGFTRLLAEAVVPHGGSVTALDASEEMLAATRDLLDAGPHGGSISYRQGDLANVPLEEAQFDLVWSSRTIHHVADQVAGARALARLAKPGGRVALREGLVGTRFLPDDIGLGEPGLEDRLDVAFHRWFQSKVRSGDDAVRYPFGWTQMLRDAGMQEVTARTFMLEALAPFTEVQVSHLSSHLRHWVDDDDRRSMLAPDDADVLTALTDAASEHFIFKRPDLYLREPVTVYVGMV